MAKDPAFLFYPQDFITGTMFMSDAQIGKYMKLLCAQHQHGGVIDVSVFNNLVGEDKLIREKFVKSADGFYNKRLFDEMLKRKKKSENLSANAMKRWEKEKQRQCKSNTIASNLQMPIENEDEKLFIKDIIKYLNEKTGKKFSISTKKTIEHINGRISEGYTVDDFKKVVDNKCKDWLNDAEYCQFLRPNTLFAPSHFEEYLNANNKPKDRGGLVY